MKIFYKKHLQHSLDEYALLENQIELFHRTKDSKLLCSLQDRLEDSLDYENRILNRMLAYPPGIRSKDIMLFPEEKQICFIQYCIRMMDTDNLYAKHVAAILKYTTQSVSEKVLTDCSKKELRTIAWFYQKYCYKDLFKGISRKTINPKQTSVSFYFRIINHIKRKK